MHSFASSDKQDGAKLLSGTDSARYLMPNIGDEFTLTFAAPPQAAATMRSLFVKTRGYYDLHVPGGRPEQSALIANLMTTPDAIAKYSLRHYLDVIQESASNGIRQAH